VVWSLELMSYEEEDACMSYEEEDRCGVVVRTDDARGAKCHLRRRMHACQMRRRIPDDNEALRLSLSDSQKKSIILFLINELVLLLYIYIYIYIYIYLTHVYSSSSYYKVPRTWLREHISGTW
jgi:hypothetical protein